MKDKKSIVIVLLCRLMRVSAPAIALADAVYYKGSAVFWNYGRNVGVLGFSDRNFKRLRAPLVLQWICVGLERARHACPSMGLHRNRRA